jgi:hypothetical protein
LVVGGGLCLAVDRFGLLGLVFGWEMLVVVAADFGAGLALLAFLEVGFADEISGACVALSTAVSFCTTLAVWLRAN